MSFKQLTIGIWSGNADGPLSVVTAMGATLLKFCQLLARNYNRNNQFNLSPSLFILALISHSSPSVTFSLDATGRDFCLLLEPCGTLHPYILPIRGLTADRYRTSGKVAVVT